MIRLFTRPGKFSAIVIATLPPIEWPSRCAVDDIQMIEQGNGVIGHLFDRIDLLRNRRARTAARIVQNKLQRFRQARHLVRLPHFTGKRRGRKEQQRFSRAVSFVVEIRAGG